MNMGTHSGKRLGQAGKAVAALLLVMSVTAVPARASSIPVTLVASDSLGHAASATFTVSGNTLTVVLTSEGSVWGANGDLLTGLFFKVSGATLSGPTASLASGSSILDYTDNLTAGPDLLTNVAGTNVGGDWAYKSGITSSQIGSGTYYGLGAAGFGIFGNADIIDSSATPFAPGTDKYSYGGGTPPDGPAMGIIPGGAYSPNGGSTSINNNPIIQNAVVFTFTITGTITSIDTANFQFGTQLNETQLGGTTVRTPPPSGVPLPGVAVAGFVLLSGLGLKGLRRRL